MLHKKKEREKGLISRSLVSLLLLSLLKVTCVLGKEALLIDGSKLQYNDFYTDSLKGPSIDPEFKQTLIEKTCGEKGTDYSKDGLKFVREKLEDFSSNEYYKLKSLKKLPKIYSGKNAKLMLKSFKKGEVLGSPLRLRLRILKNGHSIPVIEDDFTIFPEDLEGNADLIYPRVMNEVRYSMLLCGGGLISLLPVIRYLKQLSSFGEYVANDPIILRSIGMYERERTESRRRSARIEEKYLTTLPYSNEIYTGKSIRRGGLIIGVSDSMEEERDLVAGTQGEQNGLNDGSQGAILGLNIRAREEYFDKLRENAMNTLQSHFVYSSIFDFNSPTAFFTMSDENLPSFDSVSRESMGRNKVPHQITKAESIKNTTIQRVKSSLEGLDSGLSEYSSDGSVEAGAIDPSSKKGETVLPGTDLLNPDSVIIGRKIRPNDQITTGSLDEAKIVSESELNKLRLEPIKGFPTSESIDKEIVEIFGELEDKGYASQLISLESSKTYSEAYKRFPAYVAQKKIIPLKDQAYIFWESLRLSSGFMEKKHGVSVSNFPDKQDIPSETILPKKTPVVSKEITRSCYRLLRYFQKSGTPFIFRTVTKIQDNKTYSVDFTEPTKQMDSNRKYKEYAKMLCNKVLPKVFVLTFHNVFEALISKREEKYYSELEDKKLELEVQQKEADALKKIHESVVSRAHITPYIVEKPYERYLNAWRRSFGYNGFLLYPRIKTSVLEKMYNVVKFGPQIIEKKKKNASPEEVRTSVAKALVKVVDEHFAAANALDLLLDRKQVEEFVNNVFSQLFSISMADLIKKMPIAPEMDIKTHGSSFHTNELFVSCVDYIRALLNFNKSINAVSANLNLDDSLDKKSPKDSASSKSTSTDNSVEIKILESGHKTACMFISRLLKPHVIEYSLALGSDGGNTKALEKIKSSFIHQSLTDGSSKIPFWLGMKMFEETYIDVYKRVCEQHGILYFIPDNENQYFGSFPMFNDMARRTRVELTSETINFQDIEGIFLSVYESIVNAKGKLSRLEFFNENIMAEFILGILTENNVVTPSEIKSLPAFPVSHKYPWSPFFNHGLNQWCTNMILSLVDQKLLRSSGENKVFDRNSIESAIKLTCTEETTLRIRNNIEYEADEILRRNFAHHLATSLVYWYFNLPMPKWILFENWENTYSSDATITLSEEPEISLATFILFKCIADIELGGSSTPKGKEMASIKRELSNTGNGTGGKTRMARLSIWNNTPVRSTEGGRISLAYFLFPDVIGRDILAKLSPEDVLAFTGPHDILWVGADEREFIPMCLGSIKKLGEFLSSKKLNSNEEISIWVSDSVSARELFCRDIAGRFFYPRGFTTSDSELSREVNPRLAYSIERLKLRRSQWLAIQEAIRRRTEREESGHSSENGQEQLVISHSVYSSFVVDFQESDEFIRPGSFMRNCVAAFDTAMMFPEGSPYKLKISSKPNETIRDICEESVKLFYSSAVPMDWDEQQSQFNPISPDDKYSMSRVALAQHNAILEQIEEQNMQGDYSIRGSERFSYLFSLLIGNIGVSDSTSRFMEICSEYVWECIKRKLLFLGSGYDTSNSNELIENICRKSSYRYFVSNVPIKAEEISMLVNSGKEVPEWHRVRYKAGQWKILEKVFDSFASRYHQGYEVAISKTFKLPKFMQLANFNTSEDIFTVEDDCKKAMSYLINLHSCASEFVIIFGRVGEFCDYVSRAFKQSNV